MNSVVITGSTRGLGFEMAKRFRESGWNVLVNGVNAGRLESTVRTLSQLPGTGTVEGFRANVASKEELQALADFAVECFGSIDIWINNAGVNQPMKPLWELTVDEMDAILNIDLRGTVLGSSIAVRQMQRQPSGGFVYNLEGHGSNDVIILGWSMYRFSAPLRIWLLLQRSVFR